MRNYLNDSQIRDLTELFHECADALDNDRELNVDGNGVNALEAARAMQAVADILCVGGPMDLHKATMRARDVQATYTGGRFETMNLAPRGRDD